MKDNLQFFPHEVGAYKNKKIRALRRKYGWEGYSRFWVLIEWIAESKDCWLDLGEEYTFDELCEEMGLKDAQLNAFLDCLENYCNLIVRDGDKITATTIQDTYAKVAEDRKRKSKAGKASASKRAKKIPEKSTAVQQPFNSRSTAEVQSKVKESKEEESKGELGASATPALSIQEEFIKRATLSPEGEAVAGIRGPKHPEGLPDFEQGATWVHKHILDRVATSLREKGDWEAIAADAGLKMTRQQFLQELKKWITKNQNRYPFYCHPEKVIRGGHFSFFGWLQNNFSQEKYGKNQEQRRAATPTLVSRSPIRKTFTDLSQIA